MRDELDFIIAVLGLIVVVSSCVVIALAML